MKSLFSRIPTNDAVLSKVEDAIDQAFGALLTQAPLLDGVRISGVAVTTSDTQVSHGLGRAPIGWLILDRNANQNVWRSAASTDRFLTLKAGGSVTIDLWVF